MFMGELEITNTNKLTKVKMKIFKKYMLKALLITIFLIAVNLIISIGSILENREYVMPINMQNFANTMFFAGVLVSLFITASYRSNNNLYSVFPQNNVSRFLSSQIINYSFIIFLAVASIVAYLIQYSIFSFFASTYDNVHLAYRFDLGYVLNGFIVFILYLSLAFSIISLGGVIFRKYRLYSFVAFMIMLFGVAYNDTLKAFMGQIISIIVKENSLILFYLKGTLAWLIIMVVSFAINKNTDYNRSEKQFSKYVIALILITGLVSLGVISQVSTTEYSSDTRVTREEFVRPDGQSDVEVDVSHLPPGSTINVKNINGENERYGDVHIVYDEISKAPDGKLIVTTSLPMHGINGINLIDYTNPHTSVALEDENLNIEYIYDKNVKVVIISPWLFMYQFDRYLGQGIFKEILGTSSQRGNGSIRVIAPENISINLINE